MFLRNKRIYYNVQESLHLGYILRKLSLFQNLTLYFIKTHSDIIILFSHVPCMFQIFYHFWLNHIVNIRWKVYIMKLLILQLFHPFDLNHPQQKAQCIPFILRVYRITSWSFAFIGDFEFSCYVVPTYAH
jgi:hypothetical protein